MVESDDDLIDGYADVPDHFRSARANELVANDVYDFTNELIDS